MRIHLDQEDRGALRAFGLSSITTGTVFVSPSWEYLPISRKVVSRKRNTGTVKRGTIGQVGRDLQQFADDIDTLAWPSADVVVNTSRDPMGAHRWSMALEHAATRFLALHGEHLPRPDVWSRRHHSHVTRPDVVAYKGTPRYVLPQPCRYGAIGHHPAAEVRTVTRLGHPDTWGTLDQTDCPAWWTGDVIELLTTSTDRQGRSRMAWRGHRRITLVMAPRTGTRGNRPKVQAQRRAERAAIGASPKGGRAVSPWAMSDRSLPRAVASRGVAAQVATLESILRTSTDGATVTFGDVVVTITGPAQVVDHNGRAYPVREWARRAALAGIDPAAI